MLIKNREYILLLDTSSNEVVIGICKKGQTSVTCKSVIDKTEGYNLSKIIQKMLSDCNIILHDIFAVVLGIGPGSTVSIRASIAFMVGWISVVSVPVYVMSSLFGYIDNVHDKIVEFAFMDQFYLFSICEKQGQKIEQIHKDALDAENCFFTERAAFKYMVGSNEHIYTRKFNIDNFLKLYKQHAVYMDALRVDQVINQQRLWTSTQIIT